MTQDYQFLQDKSGYFYERLRYNLYILTNQMQCNYIPSYMNYLSDCLHSKKISLELYEQLYNRSEELYIDKLISDLYSSKEDYIKVISYINKKSKFDKFEKFTTRSLNNTIFWNVLDELSSEYSFYLNDSFFKKIDYYYLKYNKLVTIALKAFPNYCQYISISDITEEIFIKNYNILSQYFPNFRYQIMSLPFYNNIDVWIKVIENHEVSFYSMPYNFIVDPKILDAAIRNNCFLDSYFISRNLDKFNKKFVKKYEKEFDLNSSNIKFPILVNFTNNLNNDNYEYLKELMKYDNYCNDILSSYSKMPVEVFFDENYDFSQLIPKVANVERNVNLLIKIFQKAPFMYIYLNEYMKNDKTLTKRFLILIPNIYRYMFKFQVDVEISKLAIDLDINNIKYVNKDIIDKVI